MDRAEFFRALGLTALSLAYKGEKPQVYAAHGTVMAGPQWGSLKWVHESTLQPVGGSDAKTTQE